MHHGTALGRFGTDRQENEMRPTVWNTTAAAVDTLSLHRITSRDRRRQIKSHQHIRAPQLPRLNEGYIIVELLLRIRVILERGLGRCP